MRPTCSDGIQITRPVAGVGDERELTKASRKGRIDSWPIVDGGEVGGGSMALELVVAGLSASPKCDCG